MKNAIVFGGSGFIGNALSQGLTAHGYRVFLTYYSHKPDISPAMAPYLAAIRCDVTDPEQVAAVFRAAEEYDGFPSVVINASGIALKQKLLTETSAEEIAQVLAVDLMGAIYISREAAAAMHGNHAGAIIHLSSMWGSIGGSCETGYSAAKGGVNALVKALAKELAPDGIRVNAIAPGLILSPMNAHLPENELALFKNDTPLNCFTETDDIMRAVDYLIDSPHVTGQILSVDGGIVI